MTDFAAAAAVPAAQTVTAAAAQTNRFLRGPEDDAQEEGGGNSWGARLARRYYSRLFKEYAIADLSRCVHVCVLCDTWGIQGGAAAVEAGTLG